MGAVEDRRSRRSSALSPAPARTAALIAPQPDTGLMTQHRLRRITAGSITAMAVLVIAGCSSGYDSVLWRQMDRQEAEAYQLIDESESLAVSPAGFVADLRSSPTYWDGHTLPQVDPEEPATFYYDVRGPDVNQLGAPVVSFDVLVHSGARPPGAPREEPGGESSGPYAGPPSVYTCYTLAVAFTAERMWQTRRSNDGGEELLSCPPELVEVIGERARYELPTDFDG
jgi:hypothetical protein